MLLGNIKANKLSMALLAIVGIFFYLMNLYSPLRSDDWNYCFIFGTTRLFHPSATYSSANSDIILSLTAELCPTYSSNSLTA